MFAAAFAAVLETAGKAVGYSIFHQAQQALVVKPSSSPVVVENAVDCKCSCLCNVTDHHLSSPVVDPSVLIVGWLLICVAFCAGAWTARPRVRVAPQVREQVAAEESVASESGGSRSSALEERAADVKTSVRERAHAQLAALGRQHGTSHRR